MINLVMQVLIHRMQDLVVEDLMVSTVHLVVSMVAFKADNKLILKISLRCLKECLVGKELEEKEEMSNKS
jgi:hypothetical protein